MPYYPKINVLFIHIPKTGGSFVAGALEKHSPLLLQTGQSNTILPPPFNKYSLQHQYFTTIEKYQSLLKIDITNATVFSIVRNPYDRIVSDLFFCSLITKKSSPDEVFDVMKKYYLNDINKQGYGLDGHCRPQYLFVSDDNGQLLSTIKIFKLETLSDCNAEFNTYLNTNVNLQHSSSVNGASRGVKYDSFLNKDSIMLINETYKKDFELFNYEMRQPV